MNPFQLARGGTGVAICSFFMERINYNFKNNSEDKKYFTIVPNIVLNHSTAIDQALYLQMKRIAGDKGEICYASERYFMDKLKITRLPLKRSLKYLLDRKWIEFAGIRLANTPGGEQKVKTYLVKDIWKLNMESYSKGVSKTAYLEQGVLKTTQRGAEIDSKGVLKMTSKKNVLRRTRTDEILLEGKTDAEVRQMYAAPIKRV